MAYQARLSPNPSIKAGQLQLQARQSGESLSSTAAPEALASRGSGRSKATTKLVVVGSP